MKLIRPAIFFLLFFSMLGCGKAELSRSSAKDMIQGSQELKALSQNVRLNSATAGKARALGIISRNGALTPKGSKLFSKFNYGEATLVQPVSPPNVDITGIASVPMAEDMKEVQFNLAFQYPPAIKRFAAKVGGGVAHFRRYDDGWRLESVNISASNEPYPLTAQDVSDEQAEVSAVADERAKLKADLQKFVEGSRIPKHEILKVVTGDVFLGNQNIRELAIYDTEVLMATLPSAFDQGGSSHILFDNIQLIRGGGYSACHEDGYGVHGYSLSLFLNRGNEQYFKFPKEANCYAFKRKLEEAIQSWRNTYSAAFNSLAELQ